MTDTSPHGGPALQAGPAMSITAPVLLAVALWLLGETLYDLDRPTVAVIWGGLALAAYSGALLCLAGLSQGTGLGLANWRIGSWILAWYGAAFGLATLSWSQPQTGAPTEIAVTSVLRALWLVTVGMTLWALGYFVGPSRLIQGTAARTVSKLRLRFGPEVRSFAAPWILYAIGIAARVARTAATGRFGYVGDASSAVSTATGYGEILSVLSLCAPLAVAAAAMQSFRERLPGAWVTLTVLFLVELAFGAAAGGKQNFIIAVLAVAIPFSAARRRMPKAALVAILLLFMVVVIPFNRAYRNAARGGAVTLSASQALGAAPGIFEQTVTASNAITILPDSLEFILQRIREIDSPAIIIQRTPGQIAFISPAQLIAGPAAAIVPRALWPGKPILATGYNVSQEYYGTPASVFTSSAITPVGDLYRHGGWVPVIAGMFLFGCWVRLLDDSLDVRANPHAIFLLLLLFPGLVKGELDWIGLVAGIPATLLVWLLSVSLTFRRRSPA